MVTGVYVTCDARLINYLKAQAAIQDFEQTRTEYNKRLSELRMEYGPKLERAIHQVDEYTKVQR